MKVKLKCERLFNPNCKGVKYIESEHSSDEGTHISMTGLDTQLRLEQCPLCGDLLTPQYTKSISIEVGESNHELDDSGPW